MARGIRGLEQPQISSSEPSRDRSWRLIVDGLKAAGVDFVATVPDSRLAGLERMVAEDPHFEWTPMLNEGDGLAVCAGAWLAGKVPALAMEDTGFLVALHALQVVCEKFGVPVLLIMSHRGELGDGAWWLARIGARLPALLDAAGVRYALVDDPEAIIPAVTKAVRTMEAMKFPVAVLLGESALG